MQRRTTTYVLGTCAIAALSVTAAAMLPVTNTRDSMLAAVSFAALGFLAQALGHAIGKEATGNISFIPYLAIALLSPDIIAVSAVTVSVAIVEVNAKRAWMKGVFNVAQYALAISLAIVVYRIAGGIPFLNAPKTFSEFAALPLSSFLLSSVLMLVFLIVNNSAVSGVIAISERRSFSEVWRRTAWRVAGYDALSLPFVVMFVGAYCLAGPTGAFVLAAPMLAVRQLYKTNWQLQRANQDLLELMVAAIEARDPYTSGHSRRVSRYATIIASAIGLKPRDVEVVTTAALLHDVGKIHEAFAVILQKPGKLTAEEWAIMETHAARGADLVSKVSHLQHIVPYIMHHHENWDGSGYPGKLRGDAIPLVSRIIMIADTIDAMTTDRPYRAALTEVEVRREIMRCSGSQFDPAICDGLLASPRFPEIFAEVEPARSRINRTPLQSLSESRASA